MKTELKLNQRLFELTSDLKSLNEEVSKMYEIFTEKKKAGATDLDNYSTHQMEILIAEVKGKISILKEVLEVKD